MGIYGIQTKIIEMNPLITIITPTYNRSTLLARVFDSLQKQTNKNFEWLIIDDGSDDNTKEIVAKFIPNGYNMSYYIKQNGGKHTAINLGVKMAKGDFVFILDSDDFIIDEAIAIIESKVKLMLDNSSVGGIAFRRMDENNVIIGNSNFQSIISTPIDIRYKQNVTGDLVEIYRTNVLLENPFPEIENERFCPEILVWNRIANKYKIIYYNHGIYISEYLEGGLTEKIVQIRMNSPIASMLTYSELALNNIPLTEKLKANINFWRFSFNDKDWSLIKKIKMSNCFMLPLSLPIGALMYINDKRKTS